MSRRLSLLVSFLWLFASSAHAGSGVPMLDKDAVSQGSATVSLAKGSVKLKIELAPLPATIDTGAETFEATIYKAYLLNSLDPAIEIPLGSVYPTGLGRAAVKAKVKGDLSGLGLDKVVVVGFSKDGLQSFDVLTGTLVP
jgi:hypothetical protein